MCRASCPARAHFAQVIGVRRSPTQRTNSRSADPPGSQPHAAGDSPETRLDLVGQSVTLARRSSHDGPRRNRLLISGLLGPLSWLFRVVITFWSLLKWRTVRAMFARKIGDMGRKGGLAVVRLLQDRFRFHFGLRALLLFTTLVCVFLGVWRFAGVRLPCVAVAWAVGAAILHFRLGIELRLIEAATVLVLVSVVFLTLVGKTYWLWWFFSPTFGPTL